MTQALRYATRDELVGLLAEDDTDPRTVRHLVERLADLGVDVDHLVSLQVTHQLHRRPRRPRPPRFHAPPAPQTTDP